MVGTQADIHERKLFEHKLVHIAHHDTLTGLPNRSLFLDRLAQSLARASRFRSNVGVLFLDLDGFKKVNDTHGHNVGDLLLQHVAKRLLQCVRKVDTVARFGGDEFLIILADIKTPEDGDLVAGRIVQDISKPYLILGNTCTSHQRGVSLSRSTAATRRPVNMPTCQYEASRAQEPFPRVGSASIASRSTCR
jgi:diguanylate cyclase (GGDEF)-like protein